MVSGHFGEKGKKEPLTGDERDPHVPKQNLHMAVSCNNYRRVLGVPNTSMSDPPLIFVSLPTDLLPCIGRKWKEVIVIHHKYPTSNLTSTQLNDIYR